MAPKMIANLALASLATTALIGGLLTEATDCHGTDEVECVALLGDDECLSSDPDGCTLNALQIKSLKAHAVDAAEDSSSRRRKTEDLSVEWQNKIYAWVVYIHKNVTQMQWKLLYFKEDMNSTNNTLFGVPGVRGVNGTFVDWNKHPATWLPTFSLLEDDEVDTSAETAALLESLDDLGSKETSEAEVEVEEEVDQEDMSDEATRRRKLKGVPPRKKRMQELMTEEQTRINDMWFDITQAERTLSWMTNYMGANRRLYHGHPVLGQISTEEFESKPREEVTYDSSPSPEVDLVDQIHSALNQTEGLWARFETLGGMIMATKMRVHRYMKASPVNQLQTHQQLNDDGDDVDDVPEDEDELAYYKEHENDDEDEHADRMDSPKDSQEEHENDDEDEHADRMDSPKESQEETETDGESDIDDDHDQ